MDELNLVLSEFDGKSILDWEVTLDIKGAKKYILVAGIDYHTGNSFIKYCNDYKAKIIANNKSKEDLTFIIIDMKGTIETIDNGKSISVENYDKISKANYPASKGHGFDSLGKSKYVTKKSIYEIVEKIGTDDPNTLQEVNVFSHSYALGPILGNSRETDAIDLDMRVNDVKNKTFDYAKFQKAFTPTGLVKIWGCNMNRFTNNLIKQIMKSSKYLRDGKTSDSTIFTIKDTLFQNGDGTQHSVSEYIYTDCRTAPKNGLFEMTMLQVKKQFARNYWDSYPAWLSNNCNIKVLSALPSTYALFSSPDLFRISDDTKGNINFFEKYLKITIGEHNYGIYDQSTVQEMLKFG